METIKKDVAARCLDDIDTIITELEISKGKGNLILCVVNTPIYREKIISLLRNRFSSKVIFVDEGEDIIQTLKEANFNDAEILIWSMPEKLTEDQVDSLNNFRELFYVAKIPNLMLLGQSVLDEVIKKAPDFWRYRGNYYELKEPKRGMSFQLIDVLSDSHIHYKNKDDLLKRKQINEYLLEKITDKKARVKVLNELGIICFQIGDYKTASKYFDKVLEFSTELDDKKRMSGSMHNLGTLAQVTGYFNKARWFYQKSLEIAKDLDDKSSIATALYQMGSLAHSIGDIVEAQRLCEESLNIFEITNDKTNAAKSLHLMGVLAHSTGDYVKAKSFSQKSLEIFQDLDDKSGIARSLHLMAILAQSTGNFGEARSLYQQSLIIFQDLGDKDGVANTLAQLSRLEEDENNLNKALKLITQAEKLFLELGVPAVAQAQEDRKHLERLLHEK